MNPERVRTAFREFEKPNFPRRTDALNEIFNRVEIDENTLEEIGKKIADSIPWVKFPQIEKQPTTEDGHVWPFGLRFQIFDYKELIGKVVVLFPDQSRSITFYADYVEEAVGMGAWNSLQSAVDDFIPERLEKELLKTEQEQQP